MSTKGNEKWLMIPGFGSSLLHRGQTELEVETVLGKRESLTRKFKGQYFYNFPSQGIEVDFGRRGGVVEYLFFFREGFRGNSKSLMFTLENIQPGDPREKVLRVFGRPQAEDQRRPFLGRRTLDAWLHYDAGINFQLGTDDCINMITICAPV